VMQRALSTSTPPTTTAPKTTLRHPEYRYSGIIALGSQHCYLPTNKQRRFHSPRWTQVSAPTKCPFQGSGISYSVVEFTRDMVAFYASSVIVGAHTYQQSFSSNRLVAIL